MKGVNATNAIVEIVKHISGKTNLLSLNAKIEVSRSGEHGRGFAVAAEEVRKLADQSAIEADKIYKLIKELSGKIEHINKNTELISSILTEQADSKKMKH